MTRLFLNGALPQGREIILDSENSHYVCSVLRMRKGEILTVVDSDGNEIICETVKSDSSAVVLRELSRSRSCNEAKIRVTLFQSVSKGERMDYTVQKSTELGVFRIIPVFSERCVVKPETGESSKLIRWRKIALEAARQSQRGIVPEITYPVTFIEALTEISAGKYDTVIFPWENERGMTLKSTIRGRSNEEISDIAVFIGPEGGYSDEEAAAAVSFGAVSVTLGPRILRTETAGPAVLAMLMYELG